MTIEVRRRALLACALPGWMAGCATPVGREVVLDDALAGLQAHVGGKLGVFAQDTGTGDFVSYNAESRFAMCSTFKVLLAAAVLDRVDDGQLSLDQTVAYGRRDLVPHAPVTGRRVEEGRMSVRDLLAAAVEVSDNPAANLLLPLVGGPSGVTDFVRSLGDVSTRLDRMEPELNSNLPGDLRDTTTPLAMAGSVRTVVLGRRLSVPSRAHLTAWMVASTTGQRRLRAGLPDHWRVGDKTGGGARGALNDVAVAWPSVGAPLVLAVFMSGSTAPLETREAVHAVVARLVVRELASPRALAASPA